MLHWTGCWTQFNWKFQTSCTARRWNLNRTPSAETPKRFEWVRRTSAGTLSCTINPIARSDQSAFWSLCSSDGIVETPCDCRIYQPRTGGHLSLTLPEAQSRSALDVTVRRRANPPWSLNGPSPHTQLCRDRRKAKTSNIRRLRWRLEKGWEKRRSNTGWREDFGSGDCVLGEPIAICFCILFRSSGQLTAAT